MPFGGTAMENDFCRAGVLSQVARREERERRERLVADGASADAVRAEDHDEVIENVSFVTLEHVRAAAAKDASMRGRALSLQVTSGPPQRRSVSFSLLEITSCFQG